MQALEDAVSALRRGRPSSRYQLSHALGRLSSALAYGEYPDWARIVQLQEECVDIRRSLGRWGQNASVSRLLGRALGFLSEFYVKAGRYPGALKAQVSSALCKHPGDQT